eukprot:1507023-Rhodomonas_salina.1
MAGVPRWKENQLRQLVPVGGVLTMREDWTTWSLAGGDKFAAMDYEFFIQAAEALILVNDKFNYFVNHPAPDVQAQPAFKKAVIMYLVAHGLEFPINADNVNPASNAKFASNYLMITKILKGSSPNCQTPVQRPWNRFSHWKLRRSICSSPCASGRAWQTLSTKSLKSWAHTCEHFSTTPGISTAGS